MILLVNIKKQFDNLFVNVYIPLDAVVDLDITIRKICKELTKASPDFNKVNILADDVRNTIANLLCDDSYSSTERKLLINFTRNFNQAIHNVKNRAVFTKVFCI